MSRLPLCFDFECYINSSSIFCIMCLLSINLWMITKNTSQYGGKKHNDFIESVCPLYSNWLSVRLFFSLFIAVVCVCVCDFLWIFYSDKILRNPNKFTLMSEIERIFRKFTAMNWIRNLMNKWTCLFCFEIRGPQVHMIRQHTAAISARK